jgi:serine/threonine protein kinase
LESESFQKLILIKKKQDQVILVLEDLSLGPKLSDLLADDVVYNATFVRIYIFQLLRLLDIMHSKGFVHRSLNASNIWI